MSAMNISMCVAHGLTIYCETMVTTRKHCVFVVKDMNP